MPTKKSGDPGTERVTVWLTPEQLAWLKTKTNVSQAVRALVTEAMNLDRLAESVRAGRAAPGKPAAAKAGKKK